MRAARSTLGAALAIAALLAAPTVAEATTTVLVSGSNLQVVGSAAADTITVSGNDGGFVVVDPAGVTPFSPCLPAGVTQAICPSFVADVIVAGGGMADTLHLGSASQLLQHHVTVSGGAGDDTIDAGYAMADDDLAGDDGDDTFLEGPSDTGADEFDGGSGTDFVRYHLRTAKISVTPGEPAFGDGADTDANTLTGEEGDDVTASIERLQLGEAGDTVNTGPTPMEIWGNLGDDHLYDTAAGGGADILWGGGGNDVVQSDVATADTLYGGPGDDTINAYAGGDTLYGDGGPDDDGGSPNDGNDLLRSGSSTAQPGIWAYGEGGDDRLYGSWNTSSGDLLEGGGGADGLFGRDGDDTLRGGAGNDSDMYGGGGDDTLEGGDGDDYFNCEPGQDTQTGGAGTDKLDLVFNYPGTTGATISNDGARNDTCAPEGPIDNITAEYLNGSLYNDVLTGSGGADRLVGNFGVDTLNGQSGDDVLEGGPDADTLNGAAGTDTLDGGAGVDTLDGGTGADAMNAAADGGTITYASRSAGLTIDLDGVADDGEAGEGDNAQITAGAVTTVLGGSAADGITGSSQRDVLDGRGGSDSLAGGAGNDTLDGGTGGADVLDGGTGADVMNAGADGGVISYLARTAAVTVTLDGAANDGAAGEGDNAQVTAGATTTVSGGSANDTLTGSTQADVLMGEAGADTLYGGTGDDALLGEDGVNAAAPGAGGDTLFGGPGADRLAGDGGADVLDGQEGADAMNAGRDGGIVTYGGRSVPVTVTLDGAANDGAAGEGDDVDVTAGATTTVVGGSAADTVTGSAQADALRGGGGADTLRGGDGADAVWGQAGDDPAVEGGPGVDDLRGGGGSDRVLARDGVQDVIPVFCDDGPGDTSGAAGAADVLEADDLDVVTASSSCEQVERGTAPPDGGGTPAPAPPASGGTTTTPAPTTGTQRSEIAPQASLGLTLARTASVSRKGVASLKLTCVGPAAKTCRGTLAVTVGRKRAGRVTFAVRGGRTVTVRVKLSSTARRTVAKRRSVKASVTLVLGSAAAKRASVTLRAARR